MTGMQVLARHRLDHTAPAEPVLRWEGDKLRMGDEVVAYTYAYECGVPEWLCPLSRTEGTAPTLTEARTAAEQAVRDWLKRAGCV